MDTKILIAGGAVAVALLAAPVARAGLVLEASVNGGPLTTLPTTSPCPPIGPGSCSVPLGFQDGSFRFDGGATAVSQSPGPPNPDLLETNVVDLANVGTSAQTIELLIGDINFTNPNPSGLNLISSISGEVALSDPPPASTLSYISCLDPANRQNYCYGVVAITTSPQQFALVSGPFGGSNSVAVTSPVPGRYSLTEEITITLQPSSTISFTADTDVAHVPEPASIALLGVGLFGMGFLRRRGRRASGVEANQAG